MPKDVELTDPLDSLRKTFNPSTMDEYKGGPMPTVSWNVRYLKKYRYDTFLEFKFVVGGVGPTGLPTDSVETRCVVKVPGLAPSFACSMTLPDSVYLNPTKTDVTPNPFPAVYKVWNTSRQTAKIMVIDLNYPLGDDIDLDVATPTPKTWNVNQTLAPGDTITATWLFKVRNRITRRLERIFAVAYDDEGNPVLCDDVVPIANLETALICSAKTSRDVVKYIPVLQEYDTSTWVITADLVNTGGFQITDVTAEIELADSSLAQYVEFDPTFPDNSNPKSTPIMFPQSMRTFQWGFRLASPNMTGKSVFPFFNVRYKSVETPTISSGCDVPIEIQPVVMPVLECKLEAPDTIWFNTDRYIPLPFDLKVRISNIGNGDAFNVHAYVLQDTRFNIIAPSSRDFGQVDAGKVIDFRDLGNDGFVLKVNPRQTDGYDTVRVMVVADGIPSAICEYPIYVLHEQRPIFAMQCQANPDRLQFNDILNDYVPNPFDVTTVAVNVGDTRADNCQLVFVGPPRFTPVDNTPIVNVGAGGVMQVGDTVRYTWKLVPLKRLIGGWDTLVYQIQGRGGMGHRLIIGECRVPIYVPPARAADYQMVCDAPSSLTFDNSGGVYVPDPFTFTVRVTNNGAAEGMGLEMTAVLPPGLIFASGETPTKKVGNLAVGSWAEVKWLVRPVAITSGPGKTHQLCAEVVDTLKRKASCCSNVYVPPATKATLGIVCDGEYDTLKVDRQRGDYEDNPFWVTAKVTNNGDRPADNVKVVVMPDSMTVLRVLEDPERYVALRLDPKVTSDTICWRINAIPRATSGYIDIRFIVTADGLPPQECVFPVYIPEIGKPMLRCYTESSMKNTQDTLFFDYGFGDYRDDVSSRSSTNKYNVFRIDAYIFNDGAAQANRVKATLLPPEGVTLDVGETPIKELGDILVLGTTKVSWNVRPIRQKTDALRSFDVELNSDNALKQKCTQEVVVKGAPKNALLSMPLDPVGRYGDKITVPIRIDPTIGKDVYQYKLAVRYNPELVRFIDALNANTLTERGWSGPRAKLYKEKGATDSNVVRIEDYTTGSPLNTKSEEVLVSLWFEAVLGGAENQMKARADSLVFLRTFTYEKDGSDRTLVSSINYPYDDSEGNDVDVEYRHGMVTVSGDCIVPLESSEAYSLSQNKPNPFNPTTTIEYSIPEETDVTLKVFDQLGREVRTLVNEHQKAGKYTVIFDGGNLPSGAYVYRIDTPKYSRNLRMVLTR